MGASFKCPTCKKYCSCPCDSCKDNPTHGELAQWTEDGNSVKCPYCGVVDSFDSWEDEAWSDIDIIMTKRNQDEQDKSNNLNRTTL